MKQRRWKGSYTVEAAIYIPFLLFIFFGSIEIAIQEWKESKEREISESLQELDMVEEFYAYQILEALGKELEK